MVRASQHGLRRELREELAIDIIVGDVVGKFTYVNKIKRSHSVEIIFFAQLADLEFPLKKQLPIANLKSHRTFRIL